MGWEAQPKFSLIMATVHRVQEVERFLQALAAQPYTDLEMIVVDQNPDERLNPVLARYADRWSLRHLRSRPGLSRSRNLGLAHATGEIVGFPDDDCWYPAGLLPSLARKFEDSGVDGVTVHLVGPDGQSPVLGGPARPGAISRYQVWNRCRSVTSFFRRSAALDLGGFNEQLGLGAATPWAAGEDTDFPLRALARGYRLHYCPQLAVQHPLMHQAFERSLLQRGRAYNAGIGRVLRIHRMPAWFVAYQLGRPLAGAVFKGCRGRWRQSQFHFNNFVGRLQGWASWTH